ncbi:MULTISPECIES: hypothetical protein [Bradyrhizobium]|uniref:Uncharacterized protein n=1 Tax=Bradyrhizobium vignae TaxID=1549949 RepID=A0ABS4A555_9BRAD|nr:hypothetical protein [Bradyrhizobium vignae]MBP0115411.1 hypothetical protein [Bradyrhizobium vignae]RXH00313.1 hypothetical protein EAV90_19895 [Bradyrhizobium vignae]
MSEEEDGRTEKQDTLNRRTVLAGGVATAATAALPRAALAQPKGAGGIETRGAIYMDPDYLSTFNDHAYSRGNIGNVHNLIKNNFLNRSDLKWGLYQRDVEPDPKKWGRTPQIGQAAFDHWPDFSQEARDDLEKQPARFADPKNAMNPFDTRQVGANLLEHLDEVIRIALWDYAVPIKIKVNKSRRRHHGLTTEWDPAPQPGTNPNLRLNGLTINIDCPDGGWQGYTLWRNRSTSDHITKFEANWVVPSPPTNDEGQIIFIFNGLESVSGPNATGGILQPVLQWTTNGWFIRSWYVSADFDPMKYPNLPDPGSAVGQDHLSDENRCYSKAIPVTTGDIITGSIEGGRDTGGKFNYVCSLSRNNQIQSDTRLKMDDISELTYAVCAVESYKVTVTPADYPTAPIVLTSLDLQLENNPISPIQWTESKKAGRDFTAKSSMAGHKVEFKVV